MFPWLRLIRIGCTLLTDKSKTDLLATTRVCLRVWPNDLDLNIHVNNGRYLALADIGRMHWFVRTGILGIARQQKAFPIVGDAIAKFRRDLKLFQRFEIHTRLIGWDTKWGFIEHRFIRKRRVLGVVAVRGIFKGPDGPVNPQVFLAALGNSGENSAETLNSPPLPQWTQEFHNSCESMTTMLRAEERDRQASR